MIVFVKTPLLTVASMCVRACASHCSCVCVCVCECNAMLKKTEKKKKFEGLCLSICMFMCA